MRAYILSGALLVASLALCRASDQTTTAKAKGTGVVTAVTSRLDAACVFTDDKMFSRRVAYVETHDGVDKKTYAPGYSGGIWQVDKAMFDEITKGKGSLGALINGIKSSFNIDWNSVTWDDLEKPLYSALAMRLYVALKVGNSENSVPRSIADQAQIWSTKYRAGGNKDSFLLDSKMIENKCVPMRGPDIVFVLDESGSVGAGNFKTMLDFVAKVIDAFDVGSAENQAHFSVMTFSAGTRHHFALNKYTDKQSMKDHVKRINYATGGTNTHLALADLLKVSFTSGSGARAIKDGHPHVAIVITDGQSNAPASTKTEAANVRAKDVTIISVGVGSGAVKAELEAMASNPICQHVIMLQGFSEFDSLKESLNKKTCDAPLIIPIDDLMNGKVLPNQAQNCKLKIPKGGATVRLETKGGPVSFFVSSDAYPNTDYFDKMVQSLPGKPGVLYLSLANANGEVYCHIRGNNLTEALITLGAKVGDHDQCKSSPCQNGGTCIDTGDAYTCNCTLGYAGKNCEQVVDMCKVGPNPCKNGGTCVSKPGGKTSCNCVPPFVGDDCSIEMMTPPPATTGKNRGPLYTCASSNPCNPKDYPKGVKFRYFKHTDEYKYIECTPEGNCFEKDMPPGRSADTLITWY